jgi:hypothetical protein
MWSRKLEVFLRKWTLILDAFKRTFYTINKNHNQSQRYEPCDHTWGNDLTTAVVNKPFRDHLMQLVSKWLLGGDHTLISNGKIQKPIVTLLCQ